MALLSHIFFVNTVAILNVEAYGVRIIEEIEIRLERNVSLGAIQTVLKRLQQKRLVRSALGEATKIRGGKRKRYYTISAEGQSVLKHSKEQRLSLWNAIPFFRWFCHPDLREEIEGDLLEQFNRHTEQYGLKKARVLFIKEVILLCRPSIIANVYSLIFNLFPDMKKLQWLQLIALNLLVIVCMFLPFLPGPYDKLSYGLSVIAQLTGFVGLMLVPIGILWLIQEIKKIAGNNKPMNNWNSGYYYAITATCICTFISLILILGLLVGVGPSAAVIGLIVTAFTIYRLVFVIKNLKHGTDKVFNTAPLYLLSIPIIAFAVYMFFLGPVSDYSRNYAIRQGQEVINAIESYYNQKGDYPESIDHLLYNYNIPKPSVMGIDEFQYERNGNAYNLFFVQWQHIGATREVVMYNKNDEHNVKGHFASYHAKQLHWKYYWLD